jgi:hypothetical protein
MERKQTQTAHLNLFLSPAGRDGHRPRVSWESGSEAVRESASEGKRRGHRRDGRFFARATARRARSASEQTEFTGKRLALDTPG